MGIGAKKRLIFAYYILKRENMSSLHIAEELGPAVKAGATCKLTTDGHVRLMARLEAKIVYCHL